MKALVVAVCLVSLASCAPAAVKPRLDGLGDAVADVRSEDAIRCAPREWAAAQTSYRFAKDAWASRRYNAAADHMENAESALALVRRHVADCASGAAERRGP